MTVRVAKFVDIPAIAQIMAEAHARWPHGHETTFDEVEAKQLLMRSLQRHGHMNYGGSLVLVSKKGNDVKGFIIGILDLLQPCVKELKVTDLLFIVGPGADPHDPRCMVQALREWGRSNPKVVKAVLGVTNDLGDWHRTANIHKRCGFEQCGGLFQYVYDREVQRVVSL